MSGTSLDALDAALVDFSGFPPKLLACRSYPFQEALRQSLLSLFTPGYNEIDTLGALDRQLGQLSAELVLELLQDAGVAPAAISAIGSHGQTLRHRPDRTPDLRFSLQISDPNTIAQLTGITTVADFRRRDIAAGGQGAPLVPAFHQYLLGPDIAPCALVNIGGIANVTLLDQNLCLGFDTGPGNGLMDYWCQRHLGHPFDAGGDWAAQGQCHTELLHHWLNEPYFQSPPPKSTGKETFNGAWLEQQLATFEADTGVRLAPVDVQATLAALTCRSITAGLQHNSLQLTNVYICGGGSFNGCLLEGLRQGLSGVSVQTTQALGVPAQWMEPMAFAWLAQQTLAGLAGNKPAVTGASQAVVLGGIYPGKRGIHIN
jgi:anhydro-N-acetylmuramic acid kinase